MCPQRFGNDSKVMQRVNGREQPATYITRGEKGREKELERTTVFSKKAIIHYLLVCLLCRS